jgi:hypothetical protein
MLRPVPSIFDTHKNTPLQFLDVSARLFDSIKSVQKFLASTAVAAAIINRKTITAVRTSNPI